MLVRVFLRVVSVARIFFKPERADIADHLDRFVTANQTHFMPCIFRRSHMDLPVWARERKRLASRGESLKNLLAYLDAGELLNAASRAASVEFSGGGSSSVGG